MVEKQGSHQGMFRAPQPMQDGGKKRSKNGVIIFSCNIYRIDILLLTIIYIMQTLEKKSSVVRVLFSSPPHVWTKFRQVVAPRQRSKVIVSCLQSFLNDQEQGKRLKKMKALAQYGRSHPEHFRKMDSTAITRHFRDTRIF